MVNQQQSVRRSRHQSQTEAKAVKNVADPWETWRQALFDCQHKCVYK